MNYYEIKEDFYTYPHQFFILEVGGFNNVPYDENIFGGELLKNGHDKYIHNTKVKSGCMEVDYTVSAMGYSIVSERFKNLLDKEEIKDVWFIPLRLDTVSSKLYYCMITIPRLDCVDEKNTEFWTPTCELENGEYVMSYSIFNDRGNYKSFIRLVLDTSKIGSENIFHLNNSSFDLIVSQKIKDIFEQNSLIGAEFKKVHKI